MSKHTPLPWIYGAHLSGSENHRGFYLTSSKGMTLAEIRPLDPDGEEGRANAELIFRAVSAHEELLNALKQIKSRLHGIDELTHQEGFILAIAQQAIAKAEGK